MPACTTDGLTTVGDVDIPCAVCAEAIVTARPWLSMQVSAITRMTRGTTLVRAPSLLIRHLDDAEHSRLHVEQ